MKIIIEHEGTKREINGPFNICIKEKDLITLSNKLNKVRKRKGGFYYGWIKIKESAEFLANTEPKPWKN